MSKFLEQTLTRTIARQFFLWFLVLCFTIISIILICRVEHNWYSLIVNKVLASACLSPLGRALIIVLKGKRDIKSLEIKMNDKKSKRDFKLKKLKIKKGMEMV